MLFFFLKKTYILGGGVYTPEFIFRDMGILNNSSTQLWQATVHNHMHIFGINGQYQTEWNCTIPGNFRQRERRVELLHIYSNQRHQTPLPLSGDQLWGADGVNQPDNVVIYLASLQCSLKLFNKWELIYLSATFLYSFSIWEGN